MFRVNRQKRKKRKSDIDNMADALAGEIENDDTKIQNGNSNHTTATTEVDKIQQQLTENDRLLKCMYVSEKQDHSELCSRFHA